MKNKPFNNWYLTTFPFGWFFCPFYIQCLYYFIFSSRKLCKLKFSRPFEIALVFCRGPPTSSIGTIYFSISVFCVCLKGFCRLLCCRYLHVCVCMYLPFFTKQIYSRLCKEMWKICVDGLSKYLTTYENCGRIRLYFPWFVWFTGESRLELLLRLLKIIFNTSFIIYAFWNGKGCKTNMKIQQKIFKESLLKSKI